MVTQKNFCVRKARGLGSKSGTECRKQHARERLERKRQNERKSGETVLFKRKEWLTGTVKKKKKSIEYICHKEMCSDMHEQGDSQHQDKHVGKKIWVVEYWQMIMIRESKVQWTWFKADIRTTTNIQCHTNLCKNLILTLCSRLCIACWLLWMSLK